MAAYLAANIALALTSFIEPMLTEQVNRSSVLLAFISQSEGAGKDASWIISGGANGAGVYSDGQDVDITVGNNDDLSASVAWGIYGSPVSVGDLAASIAASTGRGHGPEAFRGVGQLILEKIDNRCAQIAEKVNIDLYTGTGITGGKTNIVGLQTIAAPTGAYAGHDPATYTWWKGLLDDNGGTGRDITKELVQKFLNSFMKKGDGGGPGRRPKYATTSVDLWHKLKTDVELDVQIQVQAHTQLPAAGGQVVIPAGSTAFLLDGTWIIMDPDCPEGNLFAWVDGALSLKSLPYMTGEPTPEMQRIIKDLFGNVEVGEQFGAPAGALIKRRIKPYVKPLASVGLGKSVFVGAYLGLKCNRRNGVGRLTDLQ